MKVRVYLRVGRNPGGRTSARAVAGMKADQRPLLSSTKKVLPTVAFALDLDIPDDAFRSAARVVAELSVPPERLEIAAEVAELDDDG